MSFGVVVTRISLLSGVAQAVVVGGQAATSTFASPARLARPIRKGPISYRFVDNLETSLAPGRTTTNGQATSADEATQVLHRAI